MICGESPAHVLCWNLVEVLTSLFDCVCHIVNFSLVRLEVKVFEKYFLTSIGAVLANSFESIE